MKKTILVSLFLLCVAFVSLVYAKKDKTPSVALPIPPILEQTGIAKNGNVIYTLEAKNARHDFGDGNKTDVLAYNDNTFLGPTLRLSKGKKFDIRVKNSLNEPTTVHWHGLYVNGDSDGNMHQPIEPSKTWTAHLNIQQDAEMAFYHPHTMNLTAEQVYRGLAGLIIIDDKVSQSIPIPKTYGVDDIPIIIENKTFKSGKLYFHNSPMMGYYGKTTIVNGITHPLLKIKDNIVRLRFINADNAVSYQVSFSEHKNFYIIATDGGFLNEPYKVKDITLTPSERIEILLDFRNDPLNKQIQMKLESNGKRGIYTAMTMKVVDKRKNYENIPLTLSDQNLTSKARKAYNTRKIDRKIFVANHFSSGNDGKNIMLLGVRKEFDMNKVNFYIKPNTTEIWQLENSGGMMIHPFHIHNAQFDIISINDEPPPKETRGLHDSFPLFPNSTTKIAVHFKDTTGLFVFHCHILGHEDSGMMGQFVVR